MPMKALAPQVDADLSIGEIARRSGVAVSALRFYETRGLITGERTAGNQRRYRRDVLRRVAVIKVAQHLGLPLSAIADVMAGLPDDHAPTETDWRRMSARWRKDLDERLTQLLSLRDQLDRCIGCGCLSLRDCPLRNPGDTLAAAGPGAHLLERKGRSP